MDILIAYDIANTESRAGANRLKHVAGICEKYGQRLQFSVFQCRLSPTRMARLIGELEDAIDHKLDKVSIFQFQGDLDKAAIHIGRPLAGRLGEPWMI